MRRRQHIRVPVSPAASAPLPPAASTPVPPAAPEPVTAAEPLGRVPAPGSGEPFVPNPALPPGALGDPADVEREAGVARLFELHYSSMLRLAVLLGADDPENVVAEAYYQIYRKWRRLRDAEAAEAYLRSTVCNLTRMRIRHLQVVRRHVETPPDESVASAESTALLHDDQRVLIGALQQLPARQREALVLRHWLGLKESEIAAAMGISCGSVKTHTARGLAALTQAMEARR
ncbi:SigE family RNA polymerase sigma factor [Streptomyces brasiliscabiei]|uniref:SigE family RNA polymerase sigma factor n=2 Tax=Streptomyces TaxID=1883 RepID=A0ABU8G8G6_9ACTN|nr:SigE family RNA polymerase sigma factor [Streptomyces griseiscabiei]MBZ3902813.1 SigE family RNA polymerase sigma factor [Streptomyces griseiscabiei]MDX2907124.1 SigE family RNA polymerase sigma factor [Streptomyces griseiscabiei]